MISHARAQALASARLDGPLSPAELGELQAHLAACPSCRRFADQADSLARGLRALPHLSPSPAVTRQVLEGIGGGPSFWARLTRGLQLASSPALTVVSTVVLVAALAFTLRLAIDPFGGTEETPAPNLAALPPTELPTVVPPATVAASATVAPTVRVVRPAPTPTATAAPEATATMTAPSPTPRTNIVYVAPTEEPTEAPATAPPPPTATATTSPPTPIPATEAPPPTSTAESVAPTSTPSERVETVPAVTPTRAIISALQEEPAPTETPAPPAPVAESPTMVADGGSPLIVPSADSTAVAVGDEPTLIVLPEPTGGADEIEGDGIARRDPVAPDPAVIAPIDQAQAAAEVSGDETLVEGDSSIVAPSAVATRQGRAARGAKATPVAAVAVEHDPIVDPGLGDSIRATVEAAVPPAGTDGQDRQRREQDQDDAQAEEEARRQAREQQETEEREREDERRREEERRRQRNRDASRSAGEVAQAVAEPVVDPNLGDNIRATVAARIAGVEAGVATAGQVDASLSAGGGVDLAARTIDPGAPPAIVPAGDATDGGADGALDAGSDRGRGAAPGSGSVAVGAALAEREGGGRGPGDGAESPRPIAELPAGATVSSVAYTPDGAVAVTDYAGVTVYETGGVPVASIPGGVGPVWSPLGRVLLLAVPGEDGESTTIAVWDRDSGELFPPAGSEEPLPHRDLPAGWVEATAYYQRVFLDGSGRVELRAVSVLGEAPARAVWEAEAPRLFAQGVTAARVSPDGSRLAYVGDEQLYVSSIADPEGSAVAVAPAPTGFDWAPDGSRLAASTGIDVGIFDAAGSPLATITDGGGALLGVPLWRDEGVYVARAGTAPAVVLLPPTAF